MIKNTLYTVTGPSGVGKTTLVKLLTNKHSNLKRIITCTTRKPRREEKHKIDYYFMDDYKYDFYSDCGLLTAKSIPDKEDAPRYGILKDKLISQLEKGDTVCIVDYNGKEDLNTLSEELKYNIVNILILPPSKSRLEQRLIKRKGLLQEETFICDYPNYKLSEYDNIIVNKELSFAYRDLEKLILKD